MDTQYISSGNHHVASSIVWLTSFLGLENSIPSFGMFDTTTFMETARFPKMMG